jgi:hypothetical protein
MYTAIIITVGLIAIVLSGFSWYRNIELLVLRIKRKDLRPSDIYLDYPIRIVWLLYITIFSVGFIVNNLS